MTGKSVYNDVSGSVEWRPEDKPVPIMHRSSDPKVVLIELTGSKNHPGKIFSHVHNSNRTDCETRALIQLHISNNLQTVV